MTEELRRAAKITAKIPKPPRVDLRRDSAGRRAGIWKRGLKLSLLVLLALILTCGGLIWLGGRDELIEASVAVVPGNRVHRDGQPAARLAARLDKSLELYRSGRCRTIIVSGGLGRSRVDEARAMAAYLRARGVPERDIVIDSQGRNTWRTARFTAEYLKKNRLDGVIVVSQAFHVPRSALALKAAGCQRVGQASPDYWELRDIYSVLREIPANVVYWWRYYRAPNGA